MDINRYLSTLFLLCTTPFTCAQEKIRVGTWNIETLGSPYSRDYRRESPAHGFSGVRKPPDLATQIEKFHLDVLALEEIDDTEDGDSRATN